LQSSLALHNGSPDSEDEFSAGEQGNESDPGPGGEERKIKAEAKSNRKVMYTSLPFLFSLLIGYAACISQIADLEITNRSLLAINASLEAAKHQQAKELRELRRKLRESRLILPPRAYQAVTSSLNHDDDEEEEEEEEEEGLQENVGDESYRRIKAILEGLIETGKRALEAKPGDFSDSGKGGAKVLSAEEVRNWRGSSGDSEGQMKDGNCIGRPLTPSHIAVPHSDDEFFSEEEVEAIALALTSVSPPIHVTPSP
jgi:hypothetical protein